MPSDLSSDAVLSFPYEMKVKFFFYSFSLKNNPIHRISLPNFFLFRSILLFMGPPDSTRSAGACIFSAVEKIFALLLHKSPYYLLESLSNFIY